MLRLRVQGIGVQGLGSGIWEGGSIRFRMQGHPVRPTGQGSGFFSEESEECKRS